MAPWHPRNRRTPGASPSLQQGWQDFTCCQVAVIIAAGWQPCAPTRHRSPDVICGVQPEGHRGAGDGDAELWS